MTSSPFHDHIQAALDNAVLQTALDANAVKRLNANAEANASLPEDWEILRRRAHTVRATVIEQLEPLVEQFVAQAERQGVIVHRAADAQQALAIVLDIARRRQVKLVSKSKTMVGEEIGLNNALEQAGIRTVETDLGEYIIQLRNERPAHIITPAVHLRRQEVGATFHEKLGIPYTEDVTELTAAARRTLRAEFLQTDMGISGVNFGVAASGTLCILTNEGNGRMVTTLPPVHVALMGIERLVRDFDDLALMLYLLPRAATGQKLTVYAHLMNGPRQAGELDGPQERHLVLLDNGRRAMRASSLQEGLLCIRCGACLNACPVFREIGGHAYVGAGGQESSPYPGPIGSVVSPGLFGQRAYGQLARASSLCGACRDACPVDIDLPKLLLRVRAGGLNFDPQAAQPPLDRHVPAALKSGLRLFSFAAQRPRLFRLAQKLAGWGGRVLAPRRPWLRLPAVTGWGASRDFPRPAAQTFHERWVKLAAVAADMPVAAPSPQAAAPDRRVSGSGGSVGKPAPVERFKAELEALGGVFVPCRTSELAQKLVGLFQAKGVERLQSWEPAALPPGLVDALQAAGLRLQTEPDPHLAAGLTGALAGVAETGSLILTSGEGRPLTASLLPEIHVAILAAERIVPTLAQFFERSAADDLDLVRAATSTVLISGPSRTADIEMTLTVGVHGPRELYVFCLTG